MATRSVLDGSMRGDRGTILTARRRVNRHVKNDGSHNITAGPKKQGDFDRYRITGRSAGPIHNNPKSKNAKSQIQKGDDPMTRDAPDSLDVQIAVLESTIEAQVLDAMLTEDGIPHRIRSYYDTAYDGLFQMQKGWGEVRAPAAYQEQITEILSFIRSENHVIEEDDEDEEPPPLD
jgi:hypothetical protein